MEDPEDPESLKVLRYYNTKLIDFSKTFPNETFRGASHVIRALFSIYRMIDCVSDEETLKTNAIVPLLGFLEQVQVNSELFSVSDFFIGLNSNESLL